jgi:hypothetical protein
MRKARIPSPSNEAHPLPLASGAMPARFVTRASVHLHRRTSRMQLSFNVEQR